MRSHPIFRREGDNLYQELALEFVDAILGTDIRCAAPALHQAPEQAWHPQLSCPSIRKLPAGSAAHTPRAFCQEATAKHARRLQWKASAGAMTRVWA